MNKFLTLLAAAFIAFNSAIAGAQTTVRIALREDPDPLDPTLGRTYVGRIVFASLCDKLFDIDENLRIVPQLATGYEWGNGNRTLDIRLRPNVLFHDGERMDAEAVKASLDRHRTMQGSFRRSEVNVIERVEVVDPLTVRLHLSVPFAPLLAQLTDRAGMIMSPRAIRELGANFATRPVCAGPFRFVERVALDHITLERHPGYWNAANIHVDRVIFQTIPDSTVRLANLQSGAIELAETVSPTDLPTIQRNPRLRVTALDELGYQGITFNTGNGPRAQLPAGADWRVRAALELSIDRATINQVVYAGVFSPTAQAVPPSNPYHVAALTPPARNVARARELLREAGQPNPVINFTVPNNPDLRQVGEVIQAMAREAGFDIRLQAMEFAASLQAAQRGEFEMYLLGWSGRADPDGNLHTFIHSTGPQNDGRYNNPQVDRLLDQARMVTDQAQRQRIYAEMFQLTAGHDRPIIYLWHRKNLHAMTTRLQGFQPNPDGLIRMTGVRLAAN